ncbi:MAG: hypothetical protein Q4G39_04550, partial [Brachymonas sp.]|nr:hypothetical protein [Brachymonas sp.]
MQKNAELYASQAVLQQLGLEIPPTASSALQWLDEAAASSTEATATRLFALKSVPELQVSYEAQSQTLTLLAPLAWLKLPTTVVGKTREDKDLAVAKPGYALVLNYDLSASADASGNRTAGLLTDWRGTTPWGYLNHTHLWRYGNHQDPNAPRNIRLDTFWRTTWPEHALALTLGDTMTSQLGGNSGTRMG